MFRRAPAAAAASSLVPFATGCSGDESPGAEAQPAGEANALAEGEIALGRILQLGDLLAFRGALSVPVDAPLLWMPELPESGPITPAADPV